MGKSIVFAFAFSSVASGVACADWSFVNPANGNLYICSEAFMSWQDGRLWAEAQGGHMVTITSQAEQDWFYNTIYKPYGEAAGTGIWLGATDEVVEGEWRWLNGEEFDYNNWAVGEPSNSTVNGIDEDYASMWYVQTSGTWNDYSSPIFNVSGFPILHRTVVEIVPAPSAGVVLSVGVLLAARRRRS